MIQFFRGDVFLFQEELKDQLPLAGILQLMLPKMFFQYFHFFWVFGHDPALLG